MIIGRKTLTLICILLVIILIISLIIGNRIQRDTVQLYEIERQHNIQLIDSIANDNVRLNDSLLRYSFLLQGYYNELSLLKDSLKEVNTTYNDNYEEIINNTDSATIELFDRNISKYKSRFDTSINR